MRISEITGFLQSIAPSDLQEDYDNSGLLVGSPSVECSGILCTLDLTLDVLNEAKSIGLNLIVCHHPFIFKGLKSITGKTWVEEALIFAIRHDIAIFAIHTNLDNVAHGVSGKMAALLNLRNQKVLQPLSGKLRKLAVFVPQADAEKLRSALFSAGAGSIGKYSECSFNVSGHGTFKAGEGTQPYVGEQGLRHTEAEQRIELIYETRLESSILAAMHQNHPYEEIAYDIFRLENANSLQGAGIIGELPAPMQPGEVLEMLAKIFQASGVRHNGFVDRPISRLALCGGAGGFLAGRAKAFGAEMYVTADLKYHDFFEHRPMTLVDIGHFESEQFTTDLLHDLLVEKFPNFAVLKTKVNTNPVHYFRPAT